MGFRSKIMIPVNKIASPKPPPSSAGEPQIPVYTRREVAKLGAFILLDSATAAGGRVIGSVVDAGTTPTHTGRTSRQQPPSSKGQSNSSSWREIGEQVGRRIGIAAQFYLGLRYIANKKPSA